MKYIIRAVKYFVYICVILTIIIGILMLTGFLETDVNAIFNRGWTSVGYVAVMFACLSAVYPLFGYGKKQARIPGEISEIKGKVIKTMEDRGYVLEKEDAESFSFRLRSVPAKIARSFEDRITLSRVFGGYELEGPRRDIVRLAYGLEHAFRGEN